MSSNPGGSKANATMKEVANIAVCIAAILGFIFCFFVFCHQSRQDCDKLFQKWKETDCCDKVTNRPRTVLQVPLFW